MKRKLALVIASALILSGCAGQDFSKLQASACAAADIVMTEILAANAEDSTTGEWGTTAKTKSAIANLKTSSDALAEAGDKSELSIQITELSVATENYANFRDEDTHEGRIYSSKIDYFETLDAAAKAALSECVASNALTSTSVDLEADFSILNYLAYGAWTSGFYEDELGTKTWMFTNSSISNATSGSRFMQLTFACNPDSDVWNGTVDLLQVEEDNKLTQPEFENFSGLGYISVRLDDAAIEKWKAITLYGDSIFFALGSAKSMSAYVWALLNTLSKSQTFAMNAQSFDGMTESAKFDLTGTKEVAAKAKSLGCGK
jgi:major membrane immunogen (membrane-anchored lipoprotein)